MKVVYYFTTIVLHYLLRPYLYFRIIKKKESPLRYREKLGITEKNRNDGYLIWFHCSSIGELKSIFPIIDYYLKKNQILVTTSTLGSNEVFQKKYFNIRNITHQFAPIDSPQIVKKFFDKWKPNIILFTESELWPNQIFYAKKKNIPIILLNARISPKSFIKWKLFKTTMSEILGCFKLILCQSNESKNYFNYFSNNNIEMFGNLKFIIEESSNIKNEEDINVQNRIIFIALSTHNTEEELCIKTHISLKAKYPNLLTLIIPRHINRINEIEKIVQKSKLEFLVQDSLSNIKNSTDILIINSYGVTQKFLKFSKFIFMGGSLINHGGQNPIEVAYNNSIIFHGPYIYNFTEIYNFLNKEKIAFEIRSEADLTNQLREKIDRNENINIKEKLVKMGREIFAATIAKLDQYIIH
ncbi:MAG: glycosyltransferase N-terminal domain-containing protein [Pseudomonadota bacterium]